MLLLPLFALGLVELGLRVAGSGYRTSFFLPARINGRGVFIENDKFGWRFFPPQLARNPAPLVMGAEKPKDTYRIFILGESAALGDPEPAFGFGRWLEVLLEEHFPGKHFEVVCTAMTAINSHAILPIARECARHQGDLWIVYMGNNEFVGPFGPCSIFGRRVPPLALVRLNLALKKTRLGQWIAGLGSQSSGRKSWGGMKMFTGHQLPPDDPRRLTVYDYFQANLEAILACAQRAGVKVVLSTVASNLKDCPPFGSLHSLNLTADQIKDWRQRFTAAVRDQTDGRLAEALTNFEAAARLDASFAELQFRWAQCLLALTNSAPAKLHFELARDCDSLPFRADTRLNQIIAQTASSHSNRGVAFLDGLGALSKDGTPGIAGREVFYEHVHLNFEGNYRLALADRPIRCKASASLRQSDHLTAVGLFRTMRPAPRPHPLGRAPRL